jgi:uncharacterized membrane protein
MDRPPATPTGKPVYTLSSSSGPPLSNWSVMGQFRAFRARLISGLLVTLPIVITFWIVYWLYLTLSKFILNPLAGLINRLQPWLRNSSALQDFDLPEWWYNMVSPVLAIMLVLAILYTLGLLIRSWVYRTLDWFLLHVPVVATIYRAVRNVVDSVGSQFQGGNNFKRVVLVSFPHPGIKSLALVTNSLRDVTTGRTILSVCLLTGVMPPSGFTLYVPEEDVTNIAWSVNDTLQSILSGGLTSPPTIHFFEGTGTPLPVGGGPIVDAQGHALGS